MADLPTQLDASTVVHPKLQNLLTFWNCCRGSRTLPRRSAIPAEDFKPWMGHIMMIEPEGTRPRFRVRLHGTRLYGYHGQDLTGWYLDEAVAEPEHGRIVAPYVAAMRTGGPQFDVIASPFAGGTVHQLSRLVLPCAEDGTSVDRLIVGMYLHSRPSDAGGPATRAPRGGAQAPVRA
jgi:hypothetical protein